MSWERDPLWAKSRFFFEQAFDKPRDDPLFGLWCAMGLELLARSALANISPTLLAESDREHKYLLHALNRGSDRVSRRSLNTNQVLLLCNTLFAQFTSDDLKAALALINRRNDELHTGAAAFSEYTTQQWIVGFYRCCRSLTQELGETLETLFGSEEAKVADEVLAEVEKEVRQRIESEISAHRKVFEGRSKKKREAAAAIAVKEGERLSQQRHHRVTCPACKCTATVKGNPFGPQHITHKEDEIVVRQAVTPRTFYCPACNLKLTGYAELTAAGLGDQFTRTTKQMPDEYYGLVDPYDSDAIGKLVDDYLGDMAAEYDNE